MAIQNRRQNTKLAKPLREALWHWIWVVAFAIAFAWVESSVVVYLREIYFAVRLKRTVTDKINQIQVIS